MKKKVIIISGIAIVIIVAVYFIFFTNQPEQAKFTYVAVTRGDLNVIISSTGTLQAVKTVDVGTQVSGIIAKLYVDFNSTVRKGQLLATIDPVVLAASVRDAQANLDKAVAQYDQAVAVHQRNIQLYEKKFMNEVDFIASKTNVASLLATRKSAVTALERAKLNLNYAFIKAPISGTIINRAVEQGQTVAASLSAPTIFTIAEDLSSMWILTSVDESDIGQIKLGQKTKFTVQAFPSKTFEGEVLQMRLNPNVVSNVVNYTVVVKADNKDKLLLPGMTATVDFYVDYREQALLVPNVALRFVPTDAMTAEIQKNMEQEMANLPDSIKKRYQAQINQPTQRMTGGNGGASGSGGAFGFGGPGGPGGGGGNSNPNRRRSANRIYYVDDKGKLLMSPVMIGLTDGKNTEIVRGRNIKEGMKIISGIADNSTAASSSRTTNPLMPTQQGGGGFRPGGF
jgi:HlyD family secretion protein